MVKLTAQDYINLGFTEDQLRSHRQQYAPWQGDDEYYRWVKKESDIGKNKIGGGAGAVGNHQVLPTTFQELIPGGNIDDPLQNLQAGLMYLDKGYKKFKGNRHDTYSGYHGGMSGKGTKNWGPKTRAYADYVIANGNGGRSPLAGAGTLPEGYPGNPSDMLRGTTSPLEYQDGSPQQAEPLQAAYERGRKQEERSNNDWEKFQQYADNASLQELMARQQQLGSFGKNWGAGQ